MHSRFLLLIKLCFSWPYLACDCSFFKGRKTSILKNCIFLYFVSWVLNLHFNWQWYLLTQNTKRKLMKYFGLPCSKLSYSLNRMIRWHFVKIFLFSSLNTENFYFDLLFSLPLVQSLSHFHSSNKNNQIFCRNACFLVTPRNFDKITLFTFQKKI